MNPQRALETLKIAQGILISQPEKLEINNHIAFAYQQQFSVNQGQDDKQAAICKDNAMLYCNKVLVAKNATYNQTGFAYAIRASIHFVMGELQDANRDYGLALSLYEKHNLTHDNQYAITRNQYAQLLLAQKIPQGIVVFDELEKYWEKRKENEAWKRPNPLYANFLVSYATSIEQNNPDHDQLVHMQKLYVRALKILIQTEGKDAEIVKIICVKTGYTTAGMSKLELPPLPTTPGITHFSPPSPRRARREGVDANSPSPGTSPDARQEGFDANSPSPGTSPRHARREGFDANSHHRNVA